MRPGGYGCCGPGFGFGGGISFIWIIIILFILFALFSGFGGGFGCC